MAPRTDRSALVSLSGGQDSGTCLAWACSEYSKVEAVSFDYGQRHRVELECAGWLTSHFEVQWTILPMPAIAYMGGSLVDKAIEHTSGNAYAEARGLPSSFVPGRNVLLLGCAGAFAATRGHQHLVTGICEEDDAGYPDCRDTFRRAFEVAMTLALDEPRFRIVAPLMNKSKAATWRLAEQLGALELIVERTHTCYSGDHVTKHDWGYGCGECPACLVRAKGFRDFLAELPEPIKWH